MSRTVRLLLLATLVVLCWSPGAGRPAAAAPAGGPWSWPVAGVVSRPFDPPAHRYGVGHRGVDLLTAPGATVRSAGAGRVSYAGSLAGRGVVVVVHGALRTTYEPVTALVGLGDVVGAGDVLGRLEAGHAGCSALACLHWGLRRGEDYLDPVRLVEPGPVRLLPVGGGGVGPAAAGPVVAGPVVAGPVVAGPVLVSRATGAPPPRSRGSDDGVTALAALGAGAVLAGAALRRGAR